MGTHALIEPKVVFHRLGLAVIDEQHRFGSPNAKLWKKAKVAPHLGDDGDPHSKDVGHDGVRV